MHNHVAWANVSYKAKHCDYNDNIGLKREITLTLIGGKLKPKFLYQNDTVSTSCIVVSHITVPYIEPWFFHCEHTFRIVELLWFRSEFLNELANFSNLVERLGPWNPGVEFHCQLDGHCEQ